MQKSFMRLVLLPIAFLPVPAFAAPEFMSFPVRGYGPFSIGIMSSVLDHEVPHKLDDPFKQTGPYGYSGGILSFTGELFLATSKFPAKSQGCYPKVSNTRQNPTWGTHLERYYTGTDDGTASGKCKAHVALNYDNHPGYDYIIPEGKLVYPAASGHIISAKCIKTFTNTKSCEYFGAVAVDHGNGFITQYIHMKKESLKYGSATRGVNQKVSTSWSLGSVYREGVGAVHLHLEVLQRKATPVNTRVYYDRANYMIVDPYGYKTSSYYADLLLSKPGCLWTIGCRY